MIHVSHNKLTMDNVSTILIRKELYSRLNSRAKVTKINRTQPTNMADLCSIKIDRRFLEKSSKARGKWRYKSSYFNTTLLTKRSKDLTAKT